MSVIVLTTSRRATAFWPVSETQLKAEPGYLYGNSRRSPLMELGVIHKDPICLGKQKSESSQLLEGYLRGVDRGKKWNILKQKSSLPSFSLEALSQLIVRTWTSLKKETRISSPLGACPLDAGHISPFNIFELLLQLNLYCLCVVGLQISVAGWQVSFLVFTSKSGSKN